MIEELKTLCLMKDDIDSDLVSISNGDMGWDVMQEHLEAYLVALNDVIQLIRNKT